MTRLRSIPPANRSPSRLSSMRAATHVGMTFIGGHVGSISRPAESVGYNIIAADKRVAEMRREYRAAIDILAGRFEALCRAAESDTEVQFWQAAIEQLRKES